MQVKMSHYKKKKTVFGILDQVQHKPACMMTYRNAKSLLFLI